MKLKSFVIFLRILSVFLLNRNFGNFIHDVAEKYQDKVTIAHLCKLEKLQRKVKKVELDINFLRNCQAFSVIPNFLGFNIPHCNRFESRSIRKRLLRSAINKREKERIQIEKDQSEHAIFMNSKRRPNLEYRNKYLREDPKNIGIILYLMVLEYSHTT